MHGLDGGDSCNILQTSGPFDAVYGYGTKYEVGYRGSFGYCLNKMHSKNTLDIWIERFYSNFKTTGVGGPGYNWSLGTWYGWPTAQEWFKNSASDKHDLKSGYVNVKIGVYSGEFAKTTYNLKVTPLGDYYITKGSITGGPADKVPYYQQRLMWRFEEVLSY